MKIIWWLMSSSFPDLNWARMSVSETGASSVLDMDGNTHEFDTEIEARNWLLEDEYLTFDSLDTEDEVEYGICLKDIAPPKAKTETELKDRMYVRVNT